MQDFGLNTCLLKKMVSDRPFDDEKCLPQERKHKNELIFETPNP